MIRERMLVEMSLDIFYLEDEYEQGYDARHQKAGRPASRGQLWDGEDLCRPPRWTPRS